MINLKKKNNGIFYSKKNIEFINYKHINFLKKKVKFVKNKRARICLHNNDKSKLQEMIIILAKDTYIRPHKHLNKSESLHVIEGSADAIFFDNKGNIIKKQRLGGKGKNTNFYYRISDSVFHTFKIRSKYFIFHESTQGPFMKNKTKYANWSPVENDRLNAKNFMKSI